MDSPVTKCSTSWPPRTSPSQVLKQKEVRLRGDYRTRGVALEAWEKLKDEG
jgi:hypothetical protein